jgi:hypothetical protein
MTAMNAPYAADRNAWHRWLALPARVAVWLGPFAAGCSMWVDSDREQCLSNADCTTVSHGLVAGMCVQGLCETRPEWSCASQPSHASEATTGSVDVAVPLRDLLGEPSGRLLEAKLCHKLDINCEVPEQMPTWDGTGDLELTLAADFEGYLSISGDSVIPTLYFLSPPLLSGEQLPALTLMSPALMESLALEMDVALMGERGHAQFSIEDCNGVLSDGVALEAREADAETTRFYGVDGLPDTRATSTSRDGVAGFLNAPAGALTVNARWGEGGAALGSASILIRPGFVSYGRLSPVHLADPEL